MHKDLIITHIGIMILGITIHGIGDIITMTGMDHAITHMAGGDIHITGIITIIIMDIMNLNILKFREMLNTRN